ncbi:hypothetical protein M422DRAFT_153209, partial [Sphaerobolus stellatus SS14]
QIPCARTSLLSGIASGVGFGIVRGLSASRWVAFNWTMGTFLCVSLGTWHVFLTPALILKFTLYRTICRQRIKQEHERMQVLVDSLPHIRRKKPEELAKE